MRPSLEATCLPAGGQSDIQLVLEFECTLCDGPEEGGSSDESTAASSSTRPRPVRGDDDPNTGLLFSIDLHSHQPWVLCGRYSREDCCFGWRFEHCDSLEVWNYEDGTRVASVKIADHPDVIVAKFIPQKNWIATKYFESLVVYEIQAPDLHCVTTFELPAGEPLPWEVGEHPSVCYMLTGAEDVVVLWNGDKEWEQITFGRKKREEQKVDRSGRDFDRVTALALHPTDSNIFASGSFRGTINVWDISNRSRVQTVGGYRGLHICSLGFSRSLEKSLMLSHHETNFPYREQTNIIWDSKNGIDASCLRRGDCKNVETSFFDPNWGYCKEKDRFPYPHDHPFVRNGRDVERAFFHPYLPYIVGAPYDGLITVWDESNLMVMADYDSKLIFRADGIWLCAKTLMVSLFLTKEESSSF